MRKHCSDVCKLLPCLDKESKNSAHMRTIVTAALQRQYSQMELTFWIALLKTLSNGMKLFSPTLKRFILSNSFYPIDEYFNCSNNWPFIRYFICNYFIYYNYFYIHK